jgi:hypothetical protein
MQVFALVALSLTGVAIVFTIVLVMRRLRLARRELRREAARTHLRPVALRLIEEGEAGLGDLDELDARALADVLRTYARTLRGGSRERITRFFDEYGHVDCEIEGLRNRREWRRAAAAHALGDMGSPRAIPALIEALDDSSREVRSAVTRSLGLLGAPEAAGPLLRGLGSGVIPRAVAGQAILDIGPVALPELRALLAEQRATTESDVRFRAATVELLGLIGRPEDAQLVLGHLRNPSAAVRERSATALGRLGAADAAAALREALRDRVPSVRAAAAGALGTIRDRDATAALLEQASRDEFEPAQAAAEALRGIDPELLRSGSFERAPHLREQADLVEAFS